ncbi:MAG: 2-oxoglutarate dehydrogenase E1 component, partial [Phycisphaeraceae bacterium]|nr:2-oxoglutarate dehydrogenase E1 component [Phycisphaeraceae bacterium]
MAIDPLHLNVHGLAHLDLLYRNFQIDPQQVAPEWRERFDLFENGDLSPDRTEREPVTSAEEAPSNENDPLADWWRRHGHRLARLNPLDESAHPHRETKLAEVENRPQAPPHVQDVWRRIYARTLGAEFMHLDPEPRRWMIRCLEGRLEQSAPDPETRRRLLHRLNSATEFDLFLTRRFVGAKTFSLQGAEALIPLLDRVIDRSAEAGIRSVVIGMAHRGRLNVMANLLGKTAEEIFCEFLDPNPEDFLSRSDVRYHMGHSGHRNAANGQKVRLELCFNPSHLEFINPVAMGLTRVQRDTDPKGDPNRTMNLLIHGDAGFSGEGIAAEAMNLSGLAAYDIGGSIHVVINNQLGFTTPPDQGRSTRHCTDLALIHRAPVFHVNADDVEAVVWAAERATEFRHRFGRDVFIDLVCYRRHGHNEADQPAFTQPQMYRRIQSHSPVRDLYLAELLVDGHIRSEASTEAVQRYRKKMDKAMEAAENRKRTDPASPDACDTRPSSRTSSSQDKPIETGISAKQASRLLRRMAELPEDFQAHRTLERFRKRRRQMADGDRPLDWSAAEATAIASLAAEGHRVRLTGQDAERGTFSQRHAVLHDVRLGRTRRVNVFENLTGNQAPVQIFNSPLCEAGAMGFEFGYSLRSESGLVMWEAQFGDFVNAAQVIVDQFIASSEDKWNLRSRLTLLLPHGYEGQGPEHSSARLERFLQLAAEGNIQVTQPTEPAQYFHLLRRQVLGADCRPLVVMTPKSLLRHTECVNPLE